MFALNVFSQQLGTRKRRRQLSASDPISPCVPTRRQRSRDEQTLLAFCWRPEIRFRPKPKQRCPFGCSGATRAVAKAEEKGHCSRELASRGKPSCVTQALSPAASSWERICSFKLWYPGDIYIGKWKLMNISPTPKAN